MVYFRVIQADGSDPGQALHESVGFGAVGGVPVVNDVVQVKLVAYVYGTERILSGVTDSNGICNLSWSTQLIHHHHDGGREEISGETIIAWFGGGIWHEALHSWGASSCVTYVIPEPLDPRPLVTYPIWTDKDAPTVMVGEMASAWSGDFSCHSPSNSRALLTVKIETGTYLMGLVVKIDGVDVINQGFSPNIRGTVVKANWHAGIL